MYKRVLLALDLEGVNRVVGKEYLTLSQDEEQFNIAKTQAVLEINNATEALFNAGVVKVGLWDNHGGGNNIDYSKLDSRIIVIKNPAPPRMSFIQGEYDCVCYFGYHAMEGTYNGVLAHTFNSKKVQFVKINGKKVGEIDIDAFIGAHYGVPSRFFAGGNVACEQAKNAVSDIVTVTTKTELGRNSAIFRDNEHLFCDIKDKIVQAVSSNGKCKKLSFPCQIQKSFKRVEDAKICLEKLLSLGIKADYLEDEILVKDGHTVVANVQNFIEFTNSF